MSKKKQKKKQRSDRANFITLGLVVLTCCCYTAGLCPRQIRGLVATLGVPVRTTTQIPRCGVSSPAPGLWLEVLAPILCFVALFPSDCSQPPARPVTVRSGAEPRHAMWPGRSTVTTRKAPLWCQIWCREENESNASATGRSSPQPPLKNWLGALSAAPIPSPDAFRRRWAFCGPAAGCQLQWAPQPPAGPPCAAAGAQQGCAQTCWLQHHCPHGCPLPLRSRD